MSLFVYALAVSLPAVSAAIVAIAVLADRRETNALNALRAIDAHAPASPHTMVPHDCAA
jgi:hypothetical protein